MKPVVEVCVLKYNLCYLWSDRSKNVIRNTQKTCYLTICNRKPDCPNCPMNIRNISSSKTLKNAFLKRFEFFLLSGTSGKKTGDDNGGLSKRQASILAASVVGGLIVLLIIIMVVYVIDKRRKEKKLHLFSVFYDPTKQPDGDNM